MQRKNNMQNTEAANGLVDVIRSIVREELSHQDTTTTCVIKSKNDDGTYNVAVIPDNGSVQTVKNESRYDFKPGDYGVLYKIQNRIQNSFLIAKFSM